MAGERERERSSCRSCLGLEEIATSAGVGGGPPRNLAVGGGVQGWQLRAQRSRAIEYKPAGVVSTTAEATQSGGVPYYSSQHSLLLIITALFSSSSYYSFAFYI